MVLIRRLLAKSPVERYQSMREVRDDLARLASSSAVAAEPEEAATPLIPLIGGAPAVKFPWWRKKVALMGGAVLATLLLVAGWFAFFRGRGEAIDSVAVLPFANASGDPSSEYLSDGISESIINSLSRLPNLRVMARSTVFHFKGKESDPQKVGHELGVRAVLAGRLLQRGDTLVVQTELVDVDKGSQLWGEQYNRKLADILTVQEDISQEISEKLRLRLTGEEKTRLTKRHIVNPEAYQLYLKGRYYWNKRTEEGLHNAIEHFNQAIEKDPNYALAHAGLADGYISLGHYSLLPSKEAFAKAREAAAKALELDDTLGEAHNALAEMKEDYDWDWPGAEREFRRAIELNPGYATAHQWYGGLLSELGRHEEALAEIKRAQQLDPLSLIINTDHGRVLLYAGQDDLGIEQLRKTLEMDPNFAPAHYHLGFAHLRKGAFADAIAEFQRATTLSPNITFYKAGLGYAYARADKSAEARKLLSELEDLSRRRYVSWCDIAIIYAGLGEKDQAFTFLEKAYEQRDRGFVYMKVAPYLETLRSDPRFQDLLRRVGLPR
jgi:TolB-like protein/Tfp pilus assembly protein PilF